ncbi:MAG: hypothetical protein IJD60_01560 [Clostridia bacterium]|nr:hypothetical protein [Clostridia bacterium]
MIITAAARIHSFFGKSEKPKQDSGHDRKEAPVRRTPGRETMTMRALSDLGECIATSTHVIYGNVRLYLCVTMEPKPDALRAQIEADRKAARGMFSVDEMWSAAEVNKRWAKDAVLTDAQGRVIERTLIGSRGMTDAGAKEVFFEFNALDIYPEQMYLTNGETRIRVR